MIYLCRILIYHPNIFSYLIVRPQRISDTCAYTITLWLTQKNLTFRTLNICLKYIYIFLYLEITTHHTPRLTYILSSYVIFQFISVCSLQGWNFKCKYPDICWSLLRIMINDSLYIWLVVYLFLPNTAVYLHLHIVSICIHQT